MLIIIFVEIVWVLAMLVIIIFRLSGMANNAIIAELTNKNRDKKLIDEISEIINKKEE